MARTQAADYDQRRQAIVEAAAAHFAERGFVGASVAELAQRCQTSKSLIYHYFQSKEDILFEVMITHVRALDETAREIELKGGPPQTRLRAMAQAFMRLYVGAAHRHKVLLNELSNLQPERRAEVITVQRGLITILRNQLSAIEPALLARRGAANAAAMLFFGMINWTHTWFDPKGAVPADTLADMAVNLALGGLTHIDASEP